MAELDLKSPFDELRELRQILTTQQIADLTGLRRETISRAHPDSRFQRRTEKALSDLYAIVSRMKAANGGDLGQFAAVLRRSQPTLGGRSIADLLREGRADAVLEQLAPPKPSEAERLEYIQFAPELEAELRALEDTDDEGAETDGQIDDQRVSDLIAADSELAARLPAIEARIREWFGVDVTIKRTISVDPEEPDGQERLYLRLRSERPFGEELDLLAEFFDGEEDLIASVEDRLTIGNI